jgi:hypothetical protein
MIFMRNNVQDMKRILGCFLMTAIVMTASAQGGTTSPYSQFGLGELSSWGVGQNRGMNGVGIALHNPTQVNTANPASYAHVDSLTMLFDMGFSGSLTHYEENGVKKNAKTGNFEYAVGAFRLIKNVGVTFGIMPMTDIGYEYSTSSYLESAKSTMTSGYSGDGGFHKLFLGAGARVFKNLAVGFNAAYLWGNYNRAIVLSGSSAMNSLGKQYSASVNNYTLDLGLQYDLPIGKEDAVTIGLTYGLGHKLNADAECYLINSNLTTSKADTTTLVVENALELPHTFGAGLAYRHGNSLTVGLDGEMQRWGKLNYPYEEGGTYQLKSGLLKDSYRMAAGVEWVPKFNSPRLYNRIRYRLGVGYATPYYKIGNVDGPKQYSVSAGFGIPIQNQINARSYVNVSAQWVRQEATGLLKENTFRINIGVTFNERWFAKWKVE